MNSKKITVIVGVCLMMACCCLTILFVDGRYLPNKPCRPIMYPSESRTTRQFSNTTPTVIEEVLLFYDKTLDVQPWPADIGLWRREKLTENSYLYSCYGVDINGLSTETGCIYLYQRDENTHIVGILLRSEGDNLPCPRD